MHDRPLEIYLYAFEPENAHFYFGQSFEPDERKAIHKMGRGLPGLVFTQSYASCSAARPASQTGKSPKSLKTNGRWI